MGSTSRTPVGRPCSRAGTRVAYCTSGTVVVMIVWGGHETILRFNFHAVPIKRVVIGIHAMITYARIGRWDVIVVVT